MSERLVDAGVVLKAQCDSGRLNFTFGEPEQVWAPLPHLSRDQTSRKKQFSAPSSYERGLETFRFVGGPEGEPAKIGVLARMANRGLVREGYTSHHLSTHLY
jgi:hypothetical protein